MPNGYWDQYRPELSHLIIRAPVLAMPYVYRKRIFEFDRFSHVEIDPFTTSKGWWEIKITDAGKECLIANHS